MVSQLGALFGCEDAQGLRRRIEGVDLQGVLSRFLLVEQRLRGGDIVRIGQQCLHDRLQIAVELVAIRGVLFVQVLENRLDIGDLLIAEAEGLAGVLEMAEHHDSAELATRAAVHGHSHAVGAPMLPICERYGEQNCKQRRRAENE